MARPSPRRVRTHLGRRRPHARHESRAFIESFFSKLKQRVVWRHEFETREDARLVIGNYIDDAYPDRPHSRLGYRTPFEVPQSWEEPFRPTQEAA